MIFGKRERSRTERTAALSFGEPKGKAHNQWRLMLMFSVGWVPPLPPTLSKTCGSCNVWWGEKYGRYSETVFFPLKSRLSFSY